LVLFCKHRRTDRRAVQMNGIELQYGRQTCSFGTVPRYLAGGKRLHLMRTLRTNGCTPLLSRTLLWRGQGLFSFFIYRLDVFR